MLIPISSSLKMPVVTSNEVHSPGGYLLSGDTRFKDYPDPIHSGMVVRKGSSSFDSNEPFFSQQEYLESSNAPITVNGHFDPTNLWAVESDPVASTINQLRMAFQIQKLYEKDARGGTRYIEILKSHFGVTSPDARLQRPEYLGGNRIPININQIVQQSATQEGSTPQGTPVGLSMTSDTHFDFTKSFVEHGFVIGVMVARYDHTYQQGIERF